jgi:hypothetical protein
MSKADLKIKTDLELRILNFAVLKGLIKGTDSKEWIEVAEENVYKRLKWLK